MKHRIVAGSVVACLLVTLGVFSVGGVYAFQATDTPTSTITAVGGYVPTINSTQAINLDCNSGTPIGWGSVTPDASWSVFCSHCMSTAIPSSTPQPSATAPTVTGTAPSPTTTNTPVPTPCVQVLSFEAPYLTGYGGTVSGGCSLISANQVRCVLSASHIYGGDASAFIHVPVNVTGTWHITWLHSDDTIYQFGVFDDLSNAGIEEPGFDCPGAQFYGSGAHPVTGDCFGSSPMEFIFTMFVQGGNTSWSVDTVFTFLESSEDCTLSDGTPTAVAGVGYCQAVNGGGVAPLDDGFEFNGITFGDTACFDIGPIPTWDFGFLVVNVNIPWIAHLCLTNVDLGVIQAFGVSISLLTLSYVWGVAWAIRNLFTS